MEMSANKEDTLRKLFLFFSISVVITLPFSVPLNGLSMILLSAVWIVEGDWKNKYKKLLANKIAILFIAFYLLHVIGLTYSENLDQGFSELEKRVAFVIFPVVLSTTKYLDNRAVRKILGFFTATCFIAAVICLTNALYFHFVQNDSSYLFYHKLGSAVNFDHAVYFSFYIGVSIFIVITFLKHKWEVLSATRRSSYVLLTIFFIVFLVLLSSKMIIPAVLLLCASFLWRVIVQKKGILIGLVALFLFLGACGLVIFAVPNIKERFKEILVDKYDQTNPLLLDDYEFYHFTGGAIRLAIWKMSVEIVNERKAWLLGLGTGDSQDVLTATYIEKHVYPGDKTLGIKGFLHYNAHNQFIQFYLIFGVIGVLLFLCILTLSFRVAFAHSTLFLLFLTLFTCFSLTESTLYVQKGIVPFLFFTSLFAAKLPPIDDTPRGAYFWNT